MLGILSLIALAINAVAVVTAAAGDTGARSMAYPGKNGKIAFIRNDAPPNEFGSKPCLGDEIWIMNPTGTGQTNITPFDTAGFGMGDPVWSPDGKTLAFLVVYKLDVEDSDELDGLYLSTYDMATETLSWAFTGLPLPNNSEHDAAAFCETPYGPAWSPDGKKVAIQSYYGTATINLSKPNKPPKYLDGSQTPYMRNLAWSPAEATWAFEGIANPGRAIDTMPTGGGEATRLTWKTAPTHVDACPELYYGSCDLHTLTRPKWSPDGKTILVRTGASGFSVGGRIGFLDACSEQDLRVVDPNPRGVKGGFYQPAWSPDGEKVVFSDTSFVEEPGEPGGGHYEEDIWVMKADGTGVQNLSGTPGDVFESAPDWQPVNPPESAGDGCEKRGGLPIVFVPGFLGSDIVCTIPGLGQEEVWPSVPHPNFRSMALEDDGVSNLNVIDGDFCTSSAGPSGKIVDEDFGYESLVEYLEDLPRQVSFYGYDWRKSPLLAVPGLDEKVDKALLKAKTDKVVLMAHSMGGLVARAYVDAFPSKVDRVITIGTPFLGAPKPWLALSHGWTAPESNSLDKIIPNGDLMEFARNATGAYFLYPSEGFISKIGRWLTVPSVDALLDAQEVLYAVDAYNGNSALLQQAYDSHSSLLEVYPTNGVEWQMVVGTGVKTLLTIHEQESGKPIYVFGNGDGTVPMDSAAMGNVQPSAVHYACFAEHGQMAGARQVTRLINAYLLRGDPVKGRSAPCPVSP